MDRDRTSTDPFPQALTALMAEREVGIRELARRTRRAEGWGSGNTMSLLARGEMPPTMRAMERIARALEVKPEYFAEYRLGLKRREYDPAEVGLEQALANLGRS